MAIQKDKLTEAQKQELERLRQFVSRNRLNSKMNGTKWRAAIDAVLALEGYRPSFRCKALMPGAAATAPAEEASAPQWDEGFPANIPLYNSMEWLELNAWSAGVSAKDKHGDFRAALKKALEEARIPCEETPSGLRIIGYSR
ncbi:MAG: DUF6678 family protein [Fibrobacteria bacterium]